MEDLKDIGAFGKAVENLTSILKDTIGLIIDPRKKKAIAKAEMEIETQKLIHKYELQKQELAQRAMLRMYHTEIRRQFNLEQIGQEAMLLLPEYATPEEINIDWLNYFSTSAQDVSEDELRSLWATILAQEATKPGKYSKRTLDCLKSFSLFDGNMLKKLSPYIIQDTESAQCLIIVPHGDMSMFREYNNFILSDIVHLSSIGILSLKNDLCINFDPNLKLTFRYAGKEFSIENKSNNDISLDNIYVITDVGGELISLIGLEYNEQYFSSVFKYIKSLGLDISDSTTASISEV